MVEFGIGELHLRLTTPRQIRISFVDVYEANEYDACSEIEEEEKSVQ